MSSGTIIVPMRISVTIPVYNVEAYIGDCLEALQAQEFNRREFEVICIDNGSSDNSAAIIDQFPCVIHLKESKKGAYAARNHGLREARGDVIAFIDPDCIPAPDWLQQIATAFENRETKIVLGHRRSATDRFLLRLIDSYENTKKQFIMSQGKPELYFGYTNNMAVRSELFQELGFFNEIARGADTIFVNQFVYHESCSAVRFCEEVKIRHMEIRSVFDYFRKAFTFGKSSMRYSRIATKHRPLRFNENVEILRHVIRTCRLDVISVLSLCGVLAMGKCVWVAGRWRGWLGYASLKKA